MNLRKLKYKLTEPIFYSKRPNTIVTDIRQVALDRRWEVGEIHPPFDVDALVPRGVEDNHIQSYYASGASMRFNSQHLICIPNGISCGSGFVRLKVGGFLAESSRCLDVMLASRSYRRRKNRKSLKLSGDYFCLRTCWGDNYAHWMYEVLPHLLSALPHLPNDTRFIVPEKIAGWKIESLNAIGINQARLVSIPQHVETQCERLWFATKLGSMQWFYTSPDVAQRLRKKLLNYAAHQLEESNYIGLPSSDYIFISRQGASYRRLMNEDELTKILDKLGFEVVMMERYNLLQQVEIIRKASVVIGAHGAGLTNFIFSEPGAMLIELQDDSCFCPRPWYWKLANCFGHDYKTIVGQVTKFEKLENVEFYLDPVFFEMALSDIFASKREPVTHGRDWYDAAWFERVSKKSPRMQ